MPWDQKQHALFAGIANGSIPERPGLTRDKAMQLASEGIAARNGVIKTPRMPQSAKTKLPRLG